MVFRFRRRGTLTEAPHLRGRGETDAVRVEFTDLNPDTSTYLGQVAYLQLSVFEMLSDLAARLDDLEVSPRVASAAGVALRKYEALAEEIRRREEDPGMSMAAPREVVREFRTATAGHTLEERALAAYLTAGLLDDLFLGLASSLPADLARRVIAILAADNERDVLRQHLQDRIAAEPGIAAMLALWGRRLVGDTLLLAHRVVPSENGESDERIEPAFTELIAAHTRRMDSLGLTA
ncbi:tRNA-(MS[2]IO[6]A)-hydroxylase (MiaE)-like [Paramicrobacterium humi]|uniref:tRNA-(MS[2]IO[6]A)-hydroxylase (MiaE)-like n=1 Tax=Paramicrobacterium humi TaxID=640635 RepID=A0A1H4T7Z1_9MICO|nr:ferritin-like fold-containing protein [Microbacterium humi]SEC52633.1 tRNA-(MS[2]IO[6]A)-hydroxylase (MiaE)-like [Microbacterium humi]